MAPTNKPVPTQPATPPAPPVPIPWPPKTSSTAWWEAVINTIVQEVATVLTVVHPGYHVPNTVSVVIPIVSQVAALAGWIWAMKVHKDIAVASLSQGK